MNNNKQNEYSSYDVTVNLKGINNKYTLISLLDKALDYNTEIDQYEIEESSPEEYVFQDINLSKDNITTEIQKIAKDINKNISYTLEHIMDNGHIVKKEEQKTSVKLSNVWSEDDKSKVAKLANTFFKYMYKENIEAFYKELINSEVPNFLKERLHDENTFGLLIDSITDYGRDEQSEAEDSEDEQSETEDSDSEDDSEDEEDDQDSEDDEDSDEDEKDEADENKQDSDEDEKDEDEDSDDEQDSDSDDEQDSDSEDSEDEEVNDIEKVLSHLYYSLKISKKAIKKLETLLQSTFDKVKTSKKLLSMLPGELYNCALKSSNHLNLNPNKWAKNKTDKVAYTSIIEYLLSEILESSGNICKDEHRIYIKVRDIDEAISCDPELNKLFNDEEEVKERDDIDKLLLSIHPGARITEKAKKKISGLLLSLENAIDAEHMKRYISKLPTQLQTEIKMRGSATVSEKGSRLIFKPETWVKSNDLYCTGAIQYIGEMLISYSGNSTEEKAQNMIIKEKNVDLVLNEYTELKKLLEERKKFKYLKSQTKDQLKKLCKKYGCKVSGVKPLLIARLSEVDITECK